MLREFGHHVVRRDPDYPAATIAGNFIPRYLRGIHDDVTTLPRPERLEKRTRAMARLGSLISDRRMTVVRIHEQPIAARVQTIFDDVDVVVTPGTASGPPRVGAYGRRCAIGTLRLHPNTCHSSKHST